MDTALTVLAWTASVWLAASLIAFAVAVYRIWRDR